MKETTPIICGGMNAILDEPQGNQVFCQMNECIRQGRAMADEKEPWSLEDVLLVLAPVAHHHALGLALVAHHLIHLMTTHVGKTHVGAGVSRRATHVGSAQIILIGKPPVDTMNGSSLLIGAQSASMSSVGSASVCSSTAHYA